LPGGESRTTAQGRRTDVVQLTHLLRGDLDWIVMKCLEKDRAQRYHTANGLAADIQRHLDNEPVIARPPSTAYQIRKAWQRHKLACIAGALVALTAGAGLGAVFFVQHRANQGLRQRFHACQMGRAGTAVAAGQFDQLAAALAQCPPEHRLWEWRCLNTQVQRWSQRTIFKLDQPLRKLLISRDGSLLALMAGPQESVVQVHRFPSGEKLATLEMRSSLWAPLGLAPQGDRLAGSPITHRHLVQVWNPQTGELLKELACEQPVECLAFSPDGRLLATGGGESKVACWNLATWAAHQPALEISRATALAFAPDGRILAVGTRQGEIHLADLTSGDSWVRFSAGEGLVGGLAFGPDGRSSCRTTSALRSSAGSSSCGTSPMGLPGTWAWRTAGTRNSARTARGS
jgi:hypothetical protein